MIGMMIKLVFGLGVVFGLIYLLMIGLKYLSQNEKFKEIMQQSTTQQRIAVKSQARLTPKHSIAIVEIDGKEVVVGLSESNLSLLDVSLKEKK